jgi:hypothetical protein
VALIDPQLPSALLRANYLLVDYFAARRGWNDLQKTRLFARGHKILYRLREEWNSPLRRKAQFARRKIENWFRSKVPAHPTANEPPAGNGNSADEQDTLAAFHWIISAYRPPRHDGQMTMLLTDEQRAMAPFLERKWRKAAPRMEIHRLAGKHLGAITTNVEILSAKLRECLDRVNSQAQNNRAAG